MELASLRHENEELKKEVAQLRQEVVILRGLLGTGQPYIKDNTSETGNSNNINSNNINSNNIDSNNSDNIGEITRKRKREEEAVLGTFFDIMRMLVDAGSFCKWLRRTSVLHLALGCHFLHQLLSPFICENYSFKYHLTPCKIQHYNVKHATLVPELESGALAAFPTSVTALTLMWWQERDRPELYRRPKRLPSGLRELRFIGRFPYHVYPLPLSLRFLDLDDTLAGHEDYLPAHLHSVVFGYLFNKRMKKLPPSLHVLELRDHFNQAVDELPLNLRVLKLGKNFNQSVDKLPLLLQELEFGCCFNQTVDKLPSTLQVLKFGNNFNQCVDHLPYSLRQLHFGSSFNQCVDCLPSDLKTLIIISNCFLQKLDNLPAGLETLVVKSKSLSSPVDNLPSTLQSLHLSLVERFSYYLDHLPAALCSLQLEVKLDKQISSLPLSLKRLYWQTNRLIPAALACCTSLRELHLPLGKHVLARIPPSVCFLFVPENYLQLDELRETFPNAKVRVGDQDEEKEAERAMNRRMMTSIY